MRRASSSIGVDFYPSGRRLIHTVVLSQTQHSPNYSTLRCFLGGCPLVVCHSRYEGRTLPQNRPAAHSERTSWGKMACATPERASVYRFVDLSRFVQPLPRFDRDTASGGARYPCPVREVIAAYGFRALAITLKVFERSYFRLSQRLGRLSRGFPRLAFDRRTKQNHSIEPFL